MRITRPIFCVLLFILAAWTPFFTHAATLSVVPSANVDAVGQSLRIDFVLNTKGDSVNAIQGDIFYPTNLFSLQMVNDGNSIVNFWIEPPAATSSGAVEFAGIIPGGFDGSSGNVLSLFLNPIATGTGAISINNLSILRNDGEGSPTTSSAINATVTIISSSAGGSGLTSPPPNSPITPNPFTPQIVSDPNVFSGKYFLVFSTTDKGSGIDHYEVLEGSTWHVAQSPYLLQDQSLSSNIYVRAVDHSGNFIVVEVPARYPHTTAQTMIAAFAIAGMAVVLGVLVFLIWMVKRKKRRS